MPPRINLVYALFYIFIASFDDDNDFGGVRTGHRFDARDRHIYLDLSISKLGFEFPNSLVPFTEGILDISVREARSLLVY